MTAAGRPRAISAGGSTRCRFGKGQGRTLWRRHAKYIECHCDHGIIAKQSYQLDRTGVPQKRIDLLVGAIADALVPIELLDERIDRLLVFGRLLRHPARAQLPDRLRLYPFGLGNARMRRPFILGFPVLRGSDDRQFRKPRRQRGAETAMGAELLRELAKGGSMEVAVERPAHLELPARPRADRIDERALGGREVSLRDGRKAARRHLFRGHVAPGLACSVEPATRSKVHVASSERGEKLHMR